MNRSDLLRNAQLLRGPLARRGYMRWWHSFSGMHSQTGDTRTFFVEFLIMNPGLAAEEPILGQHPYYKRKGLKPCYVCVKVGVLPSASGDAGKQLHAFYPVSALKTTSVPLVMEVGDCLYSEERLTGYVAVSEEESKHKSLMTDSGIMEWNLEVHKAVSCHTGALSGCLSQALNALDSYWHGEGIRSFFRGTVSLDGVIYEVSPEASYGYCDKHWGRSFNRPFIQLACGKLTSSRSGKELRHSVLALSGCCPRFLFLPLRRKIILQLTYTGEDFNFGFQPFVLSRCRWETKETNKRYIWHIIAKNKKAIIKISGSCTKEQMMSMRYESPDGKCLSSPLLAGACAVGTIELYRRTGEGRKLLDTLRMEEGFCEYRKA